LYVHRKKKATVFYLITPNEPYKIRNVNYEIKDEALAYYIFADTTNRVIKNGNNYDVDELQQERERITKNLKNNGFYFFSKEFFLYKNHEFFFAKKHEEK